MNHVLLIIIFILFYLLINSIRTEKMFTLCDDVNGIRSTDQRSDTDLNSKRFFIYNQIQSIELGPLKFHLFHCHKRFAFSLLKMIQLYTKCFCFATMDSGLDCNVLGSKCSRCAVCVCGCVCLEADEIQKRIHLTRRAK